MTSRQQVPPPTDEQREMRLGWQRQAEEHNLRPVAAYWRWRALMSRHPVFWLKQPRTKEREQ